MTAELRKQKTTKKGEEVEAIRRKKERRKKKERKKKVEKAENISGRTLRHPNTFEGFWREKKEAFAQ